MMFLVSKVLASPSDTYGPPVHQPAYQVSLWKSSVMHGLPSIYIMNMFKLYTRQTSCTRFVMYRCMYVAVSGSSCELISKHVHTCDLQTYMCSRLTDHEHSLKWNTKQQIRNIAWMPTGANPVQLRLRSERRVRGDRLQPNRGVWRQHCQGILHCPASWRPQADGKKCEISQASCMTRL